MVTSKSGQLTGQSSNMDYRKSVLSIRRNVGLLGIFLPFILLGWSLSKGCGILPSISDYVYSGAAVAFTGILIAFGIFLLSYPGYPNSKEKISDNLITSIAGVLAIITALIPTSWYYLECFIIGSQHDFGLGGLHFVSAAGFFGIMGYMSRFRFIKGFDDQVKWTRSKKRRNKWYKALGWVVWVSIAYLIVPTYFEKNYTGSDVFIGETIAMMAFGTSWLLKGEAMREYSGRFKKLLTVTKDQ